MIRLSNGYPVYTDSTLSKWNKQDIIQQLRQCERMLQEQLKITNNQYEFICKQSEIKRDLDENRRKEIATPSVCNYRDYQAAEEYWHG